LVEELVNLKLLKVNPEYFSLIPRPTNEEYEALERNIVEKQRATEPIKINKNDEILDGHTRFEICNKHGLYFDTQVMDFPSVNDEKIYIIETNLFRRHLTSFQKIELAKPLEDLIAEKARLRHESQRNPETGTYEPLPSNEGSGETTELTAKAIGVSKSTYERAKKVLDEGTEEEKQKVRSGQETVTRAYMQVIRRQKMKVNPEYLPVSPVIDSASRRPGWETWGSVGMAHFGDEEPTEEELRALQKQVDPTRHVAASWNTDNGDWRADYSPEHGHIVDTSYAGGMAHNNHFSRPELIKQSLIWNYLYDSPEEDIIRFIDKTNPKARERVEYVANYILIMRKDNRERMDRERIFKERVEELYAKFKQVTVEFTDGTNIPLNLKLFEWNDFLFRNYKKGDRKWVESSLKLNIIPVLAKEMLRFDKNGEFSTLEKAGGSVVSDPLDQDDIGRHDDAEHPREDEDPGPVDVEGEEAE